MHGEVDELVVLFPPLSLDIASDTEGPAGSAAALVFDRSDCSLHGPVPFFGYICSCLVVRVISEVCCEVENDIIGLLNAEKLLHLREEHICESGQAINSRALFIEIQKFNLFQIVQVNPESEQLDLGGWVMFVILNCVFLKLFILGVEGPARSTCYQQQKGKHSLQRYYIFKYILFRIESSRKNSLMGMIRWTSFYWFASSCYFPWP